MPTPLATAGRARTDEPPPEDLWRSVGSERSGLVLAVPPNWRDFTAQANVPAAGNRLGINLLLVADSDRTGRSLLAGKDFAEGAYVSGLIVQTAAAAPLEALDLLLQEAAPEAARATDPAPVTSANGVVGAFVDVLNGPIGLESPQPDDLRTRLALFAPPVEGEGSGPGDSWIALLLSAPAGQWEERAPTIQRVLETAQVFPIQPSSSLTEANVVIRGQLAGDRDLQTASLEPGVSDLWTFSTAANRYASLFLRPEEQHLDLMLTLYGPDRQTVAQVDKGYAGATESVTDLLLEEAGVYIVEAADFFRESGRYTLSLVLSDEPAYSGGEINFGQALQGELAPNSQHYWVFSGDQGQRVSIILEPGGPTFDAILELYGPDGQLLVGLDEGFSGDPEIIAGYELPASGEFAILVRSFSPQGGAYTISLDESGQEIAAFVDAGDLNYGDIREAQLERQEAHAWFFNGTANDRVLVRVTPVDANLDLDVWLLNADVNRVAAVDAAGAGELETLEFTLTEDGQHIVLVRDFNGESGSYGIALGAEPVATPVTGGNLSYGDSVMGMIRAGASVAWRFLAQAGDVIDIRVEPSDASSDFVLILQGPDGATALEIDANSAGLGESIEDYVIGAGGEWQILLREFFSEAANYQLALDRAE